MKKTISLILFILKNGLSQGQALFKLWYKRPSGDTSENTLLIGNGRLGAMIYGNVEKEINQLNEHTVWSRSPHRNDNSLVWVQN